MTLLSTLTQKILNVKVRGEIPTSPTSPHTGCCTSQAEAQTPLPQAQLPAPSPIQHVSSIGSSQHLFPQLPQGLDHPTVLLSEN